jgi:hypothetical protein
MSTDIHAKGTRASLVERLRSRCAEIEEAVYTAVRPLPDSTGSGDVEYLEGLRDTVNAIVSFCLLGIEHGHEWAGPIPSVAVVQAQRAARNRVSLETVLLRYATGHRCLVGFLTAEANDFSNHALGEVLDVQGFLLERVMTTISLEYKHELERAGRSVELRRGERVQKLLAGEAGKSAEFEYQFERAWHVGLIVIGDRGRETIRVLLAGSNFQTLLVPHGATTIWVWLGAESRLAFADLESLLATSDGDGVLLAIGEPCEGMNGWRFTHHQAQAALLVALRRRQTVTRYAENMLLAAALQNDTLARSLQDLYLEPLTTQTPSGAVLLETLRAYFAAGRNIGTAAHAIKRSRHTVERHLLAIENTVGRSLTACEAELEVAVSLHALLAGSSHTMSDDGT